MILHTIEHVLGLTDANSNYYLFWSGFGADLSEFAILVYLIRWFREHRIHMNVHRKHMESMTWSHDLSHLEKTTDETSLDITE